MTMGMRAVAGLGLFGLVVASSACSSQAQVPDENVRSSSAKLSAQTVKFALQLPSANALTDVAVDSAAALSVGDRVQIPGQNSGSAPVVESGTAATVIGNDTQVGSVTSVGAVTLRDRAKVTGDVTSSGTIIPGSADVITGAQHANTAIPLDRYSWAVTFPQSSVNVSLSPNTARTLAPGVYADVHVFAGSTLSLQTGTYFADSFTIEPQAHVALNTTNGPVFIYVRQSLTFRGNTAFTGPNDRLLIGYAGSASPALDTSFNGTLVAPLASVRLGVGGSPYTGAIFANGVTLDPDVHFALRAFSGWGQITFDVTPTLNCIEKRADNTFAALLGYFNPNSTPATVPVGTSNAFTPNPQDRGQPTGFLAGRFPAEFSVDFVNGTPMTWQLNGNSLAIATTGPACPASITTSLTQDTTVTLGTPKANFGAAQTLTIAAGSDALVQFSRDQLKKTLGAGRYVAKAVLTLTQTSGTQPAVDALAMTRNWTELGATWDCVNDTDSSASGETCAAADTWKLDRDDLTSKNPWHVHGNARKVTGTLSAGKLQFDVTRDVWNLLGSDGGQHPAAWALVEQPGATGSAVLSSRESANPPQLVLTLATRPKTQPALSVAVDTTVVPSRATVPPLADGVTRTVSALRDPAGVQADFVDRELLYEVHADSELAAVLTRWNATIVREIAPPGIAPSAPKTVVIRINTTSAQPTLLVARLLEIDNRPLGAHRFSSSVGMATIAAAAEEVLAGRHASLNWLAHSSSPSLNDWADRVLTDGPWVAGGSDPDHPMSSNAFSWPGFASCNPDLGSPEFPHPCTSALLDGRPIFQQLTVADAWRALALSGRMLGGSVPVALVDAGFAATHPDYPPFRMGGPENDIHSQSESEHFAHGTNVMLTGYAQAGNGLGAAGPGGPVAKVAIEAVPVTYDGTVAGLSDAPFDSRLVSTSIGGEIPAAGAIFMSMSDLTQEIRNGGMLEFASANNNGRDVDEESCFIACWESSHFWPCEDDGVDCVTGMAFNDTFKDPGSNWGSDTHTIAGPYATAVSNVPLSLVSGVLQPGTLSDGTFAKDFGINFGGTSAATPFVAGITSLLVAADPTQSADREEHCLYEPTHIDDTFASRIPDALASVRCIETGNTFNGDFPTFLQIDLPADGSNVSPGQLLNIKATATDYEVGELTVSWTSDVEPQKTSTNSDAVGIFPFHIAGVQHLTATAVGSDGIVMHQTITVNVGAPTSSVFIIRPAADGLQFPLGLPVTFAAVPALSSGLGAALDCAAAKWTSTSGTGGLDFDGLTGCTIQPTITGVGSHQIVVAYTDPTTGVKSVANRQFNMIAVNNFFAQIVSPANTGQEQFSFDQLVTLGAQQINGTNVTYQWSLSVDSTTVSVPGSGDTVTFDPETTLTEACAIQAVQVNMIATNGADGTHVADSETFFMNPSQEFLNSCVK